MKTALSTALIAALFGGTVFGATLSDQSVILETKASSENQREFFHGMTIVPTDDHHQSLATIADQLELNAKDAYWHGNYVRAMKLYHLLIRAGRSTNDDLYNLACCYGQIGDARQAAKYLRLSVEAGFVDIDHIRNDPDFLKVNDSPHFQKVLDRIGKEISKKNRKNDQSAPESTFTDNSNKVQTEPASGASATVSYGPMN